MGFDMRDQRELNGWMFQTIQFALISNGHDTVEESAVHEQLTLARVNLPSEVNMREVVTSVLERANLILSPEHVEISDEIEESYLTNVVQWAMRTAAAVRMSLGKPFFHKHIELDVTQIIAGVQGNRSTPRRCDLDLVVRKVIAWGLEQLAAVPV